MTPKSETQNSRLDTAKLIAAASLFLVTLVAFYYFADYSTLLRTLILLAATGGAVAITATTELGGTTLEFIREARMELRKVVWPTRQETLQTTLAVVVMVVIMGLFLWLLDLVLFGLTRLLSG